MIKSFPFNSVGKDRTYKAEDFATHQQSLYTNGLLGDKTNNLQVFAKDSMTVNVSKGFAIINGVTMVNTSDYILKIDIADSVLSRVDKVVLRLDKIKRTLEPAIKKGDYSSNPQAPELQQDVDIWELGLADIRVNKGAVKITQADIRDLRHTKECGIATFRGMPIDLDSLYIQYEDELKDIVRSAEIELKDMLAMLNDILTEDEFGKLLALINEKASQEDVENIVKDKQDKIFKDELNNKKYQIVFKNGQMYKREVM